MITLSRFIRPFNFSKWSRPKKKDKSLEVKSGSVIISDEKGAKLSKAEEEALAAKTRMLEEQRKKFEKEGVFQLKSFNKMQEKYLANVDILSLAINHHKRINNKISSENLRHTYKILAHYPDPVMPINSLNGVSPEQFFPNPNSFQKKEEMTFRKKIKKDYYNCVDLMNERFNISPVLNPSDKSKRTGVLAEKIGMTSTWDKWGVKIPLTILQVNLCQVVQHKTMEKDGYVAMQLGHKMMNLKRLKKPQIGHFLKAGVPPKKDLVEFIVSEENLLPIGYMLSVRHFTPGQYVDVKGISTGKGFQGTIKRWNFNRQPASHGNSKAHRKLGSTGQRQQPGRVFKNKKMPGQMGFKPSTIHNLKVFKVDYIRSLIYVTGSVPGRPGWTVKIRDGIFKEEHNEKFLNFPTFISKPGEEHANVTMMPPPFEDPNEIHLHENDVVE